MSQTKAVVETIRIPLDQIKPSPYQPRLIFDLEDLRESIQRDGMLVPITVRKKDGYYELIDGERRVRLAKELRYENVPCTVIEVDDQTARRMVYKVNKQRKNYTPEEEATFFKRLVDEEGMKPYQIETDLSVDHQWVQACLNIWKFPKDIRDNVFGLTPGSKAYKVYMTDVRELEPVINRNIDEAIVTLREIIDKRMTYDEKGEMMIRRKKKISEETIKKAEEVIEEVAPELKKLETAEEFDEAAEALRREAKRRKTPEQIHEEKRRKAMKARDTLLGKLGRARELIPIDEYKKRIGELEAIIEEDPDRALSESKTLNKQLQSDIQEAKEKQIQQRIEEEAKRRARELESAEKRQIEEEAKKKAQEEIMSSPEILQEIVERATEDRHREFAELEERAREAAGEIVGPLREAILKAEADIKEVESSEKRRLLENYMIIGSILTTLENRKIFCIDHQDEKPMLMWSCGTPLAKTYAKLKEKLRMN